MTGATLALCYAAFAALATLANLAAQSVVLRLGSGAAGMGSDGGIVFALAIATGTALGLVLKYVLDKKWIFADTSTGLAKHGRKFSLYTLMGLVTTAIFWAFETVAWLIWRTDMAREAGAVIGLAIGYAVKYALDRRFVFTSAPETV